VEIDGEGHITADADGFSGDACLRDLEKLLDGLAAWETVQRKADGPQRAATRTTTTRSTGHGG
jgi:hypothetical protein